MGPRSARVRCRWPVEGPDLACTKPPADRLRLGSFFCALLVAWIVGSPVHGVKLTYSYVDNPPFNDFAARGWLEEDSLFQRNVRAAAEIWGGMIDSQATIVLQVEASRAVARTGGTFSNGRFLGQDSEGNNIFEPGALSVILSGSNPGGPPDAFVRVNAAFVDANYWFDPTPMDRTDETVPIGRTDLVSIVLHEMGHALGMAGVRQFGAGVGYGELNLGFANTIDVLSYYGGDGNPLDSSGEPNPLFFAGEVAAQVFQTGDVPLAHVGPNDVRSSQNFYHLGTCGDPPLLTSSLMNGCSVPTDGSRLAITPLDLAVIEDLGYPLTESPVEDCLPDATTLCLENDRFRVTANWRTAQGSSGVGQAVGLTDNTGYFWFFNRVNVEMVIKVLNACNFADRFWVFAGGLTNVEVGIRVADTETGAVKEYANPISTAFQPIQDTAAFATCP